MTDTKFKEGNTEATKRGKNKRTLYLNALADELGLKNSEDAEEKFYKFCVKVALGTWGEDAKPDPQLLKECLRRLYPEPKTTLPTFDLEIPSDLSRLEKGELISSKAINGDLPADVQKLLLDGMADVARIEDVDSNTKRIEVLEKAAGIES